MKKSFFLAGTLLALTPVAALLPGCGGGGDGIVTPTATATTIPGTATAGPTPTLVPTSTSVPLNAKYNLTLTPSSDSNFVPVPEFNARLNLISISTDKILQFRAEGSGQFNEVSIGGSFANVNQGNVYTKSTEQNPIRILNRSDNNIRVFQFQSGTVTISQLTSTEANITFKNALFSKQGNVGSAVGSIRVNGTISGPYSLNSSI